MSERAIDTSSQELAELRRAVEQLHDQQDRLELALATMRNTAEQQRDELIQSREARDVEIARLRQHIADMNGRFDSADGPLRELQSRLAELTDTMRDWRDAGDTDHNQISILAKAIEHLGSVTDSNVDLLQAMRESIDGQRTELETLRRDMHLAEDQVKIVQQDMRRNLADLGEQYLGLAQRADQVHPVVDKLTERIKQLRSSVGRFDPLIEELSRADAEDVAALQTFSDQTAEQHELINARLTTNATQIAELRASVEALRSEIFQLQLARSRLRLEHAEAEFNAVQRSRLTEGDEQ